MTYITLPQEDKTRPLVFYLAMEEYVASHLNELLPGKDSKEAFFMWQVEPTVIFGRNQVMEAEVNMDYCRQKGIRLFRRKSGGGCVYSDMGNIMLSFITDSTNVAFTFGKYLQRVVLMLERAGVKASISGKNDITIDGRKVSGNAFFKLPSSSIVHGTLLFDTDFEELVCAITPSEAKIKSKGVDSVRQHVTNLRPYFIASDCPHAKSLAEIENFKTYIKESFCGIRGCTCRVSDIDSIVLDQRQLQAIREIEKGYHDPAFLKGRNHSFTLSRSGRIDNVGELTLEMDMEADKITRASLKGDFLSLRDGLDDALTDALKGRTDSEKEFREAMMVINPENYISGLKVPDMVYALYKQDKTLITKH